MDLNKLIRMIIIYVTLFYCFKALKGFVFSHLVLPGRALVKNLPAWGFAKIWAQMSMDAHIHALHT